MSKVHIRIDRIGIRTQGIAPTVAQIAVSGVGEALQEGLAQQIGRLRAHSIESRSFTLGPIRVAKGHDAVQLKTAIAKAITQAVLKTLQPKDWR